MFIFQLQQEVVFRKCLKIIKPHKSNKDFNKIVKIRALIQKILLIFKLLLEVFLVILTLEEYIGLVSMQSTTIGKDI